MRDEADIPGFHAPVHRALVEPILLGGAPRTIAIANGTLAAAVGLGLRLWAIGIALWLVGHLLAHAALPVAAYRDHVDQVVGRVAIE